jgi:hypothetical protein
MRFVCACVRANRTSEGAGPDWGRHAHAHTCLLNHLVVAVERQHCSLKAHLLIPLHPDPRDETLCQTQLSRSVAVLVADFHKLPDRLLRVLRETSTSAGLFYVIWGSF